MKSKHIIIIAIIMVIVLSNITPFMQILKISVDQRHYRYSTNDGSFTFYEYMDRNFEMMKIAHKGCMLDRPGQQDKNIYRLFSKNPLAFWRWRMYFFDERYKLPYKNWEEIKKTRETENLEKTAGCIVEF